MMLAQSRTSWLGFLIAVSACFLRRGRSLLVLVIFWVIAAGGLSFFGDEVELYFTRGATFERFAGMTGRLIWWEAALQEFDKAEPAAQALGLGFMSAGRFVLSESLDGKGASTLHSDYIDALLSTGYVGLAALAFSILALTISAVKSSNLAKYETQCIEIFGIVIILTIRSVTGSVAACHSIFLPLFLICAVCSWSMARAARGERWRSRKGFARVVPQRS